MKNLSASKILARENSKGYDTVNAIKESSICQTKAECSLICFEDKFKFLILFECLFIISKNVSSVLEKVLSNIVFLIRY